MTAPAMVDPNKPNEISGTISKSVMAERNKNNNSFAFYLFLEYGQSSFTTRFQLKSPKIIKA